MNIKTYFDKKSSCQTKNKFPDIFNWFSVISLTLRYNHYTGFFGRQIYPHIPFLLPHDKSYYGFKYLTNSQEGLFLDVGANDGISALGFRRINKNYHILSLEPNLCHEPALIRLKKKLKNFDYKIVAAGNSDGEMRLNIPLFKGIPIHSAASFSLDFIKESMKKQFPDHLKEDIVYLYQNVKIVKIDDYHLKPHIIKIDTEGYEHSVLAGLSQTIAKHRPHILIEFHPNSADKIENYFSQNNYSLWIYDVSSQYFYPFNKSKEQTAFEQNKMTSNIFCIPLERIENLKAKHGKNLFKE